MSLKSITTENSPCRLCGLNQFKAFLEKQVTANKEKYSLIQCKKCSFVSVYPIPGDETLAVYYDSNYWEGQQAEKSSYMHLLFSIRARSILNKLKKYLPSKGRILDWGAGDGAWVRLLRRHGFDAWGIDPFSIPQKTDFLIPGTLNSAEFPDSYFDAVTCFHVLEHVKNPLNEVKEALRILRPGGIMIVEIPNIASWGFSLFKMNWQPLQIPTHVNHFSPETLQKAFQLAGNVEMLELSHFSAKTSPAAVVLSFFPGLTPQNVRKKMDGKYPFHYKTTYLALQMIALPYIVPGVLAQRGCIIRSYLRKR